MKEKFLLSFAIMCCMMLSVEKNFAQSDRSSTGTTEKLDKTIELFNGENLEGWYTFLKDHGRNNDPKDVFSVEDGLIHISGEIYGAIVTEEQYEDYKLVVEYKWGDQTFEPRIDRARDSGILIHSQGEDGGYSGTWMHSIEAQIIEGGTGDFIVVGDGSERFSITSPVAPEKQGNSYMFKPGGDPATINRGRINWFNRDPDWKDVKGFRGEKDVENPVGEWNKVEIIAIDDNILVYLNGILVNEAYDVKPTKGKIQIQSEGAQMYVRRVELTPLLEKNKIISIHAKEGKGVGTKIKFMPEWNAFGYFSSDDEIQWEHVKVPESNSYDVYLEWSVSDDAAGKPYILQIGETKLEGIVNKSGGWEEFKTMKIGTIKLKEGLYKVSFEPKRNSQEGGLMDFREVKLIPNN